MRLEAMSWEDALEKASMELKLPKDAIAVEEISKPEKKIMGLKKIPGVYEVQERVKEENESTRQADRNGTVEVKNGQILVKDPMENGHEATLYIRQDQLIVKVNGETVTGNRTLKEEDSIEVTFEDVSPEVHYQVEFSENMLEAFLVINRKNGKKYRLKNLEKTSRGSLEVEYEEIPPGKLSVETVRSGLLSYGILPEFVQENALITACEEPKSVKVVVARGKAPVESIKTEIDYCSELFAKEISRGLEPVVFKGMKLAEKKAEAVEGIPGIDVRGGEIKVLKVQDVELKVTDGAYLQGNTVYAERDGRPFLKRGEIGVVPLLTVVGDLDRDAEDINFDGDVVVKGNVQDHMMIKATGNITIIGSVYHSDLYAEQNIEVQGKVIGGTLRAGDENAVFQTLLPIMEKVVQVTEELFSSLHQIERRTVQSLMDSISRGREEIEMCLQEVHQINEILTPHQLQMVKEIEMKFNYVFREIRLLHKEGFEELNVLYNRLLAVADMMKEELLDARVIKAHYAQNATLKSSGDVEIVGDGCYQSSIVAGNEIRFIKFASVVKGGTLLAGKSIKAGIVGTPSEIQTLLKVLDRDGEITGRFYKGTTLIRKDELKEYAAILK
jgi:uncharacterized protein (DUF342 family)